MMSTKRRGFTLIELLVVIAIIGILAAMVFPVFARARESARKSVCLSNVKNIALAVNMYLADNNDTLPPDEHRQEVIDYFNRAPGNSDSAADFDVSEGDCYTRHDANPYLRWPVIMDEYVKNRDVWRCPSARLVKGAGWIIPGPDWFGNIKSFEGNWPRNGAGDWVGGPCETAWPTGWGGIVTDSLAQSTLAMDPVAGIFVEKVFMQSIGTVADNMEMKLAAIQDPVNFYICGDSGAQNANYSIAIAAYPEICCLECSGLDGWTPVWSEAEACGECDNDCLHLHGNGDGSMIRDPELRKPFSRHLGGVNVGFLDGHARWMTSQGMLNAWVDGDLTGLDNWVPMAAEVQSDDCCGDPAMVTLY